MARPSPSVMILTAVSWSNAAWFSEKQSEYAPLGFRPVEGWTPLDREWDVFKTLMCAREPMLPILPVPLDDPALQAAFVSGAVARVKHLANFPVPVVRIVSPSACEDMTTTTTTTTTNRVEYVLAGKTYALLADGIAHEKELIIGYQKRAEIKKWMTDKQRQGEWPAAVQTAIAKAHETIRGIQWFEVTETRGQVVEGKVAHWQVTIKLGFTLGA